MITKVIKNKGKTVEAYRLGDEGETVKRLMNEGKIRKRFGGRYEIISLEAKDKTRGGQIAKKDDYIKLDSDGNPYPNDHEFFTANHTRIEGDTYEQKPKPLDAWISEDRDGIAESECPLIRFLIDKKGLKIDPEDQEHYYTAELWGTVLSAPSDAVLIFYSVTRDGDGNLTDADFNFVVKEEFDRTYSFVGLPSE